MAQAPTVQRSNNGQNGQQNGQQQQQPKIPFVRAARRKSIQTWSEEVTLQSGAQVPMRPIELSAAGFLRYVDLYITVESTGNTADVAVSALTGFPWNVINSMSVTNAAGDSIYVPVNGYELYLINKWGNTMEAPDHADPYFNPFYDAVETGTGGTAGSFAFKLRIPFELDPRDAFCSLPNLAANKAYQVLIQWNSLSNLFATAPDGTVTLGLEMIMHYWSQPQAANGEGFPQETEPRGNGSVSLYRRQAGTVSPGSNIVSLYNVGNVIRWGAFLLFDDSGDHSDSDFPDTTYLRLNNDNLFYKPRTAWEAEMTERYGYGGDSAASKDEAGALDTGVYVLSDFMAQHEHVTVDGPRDQFLITLDSTLFQFEANQFGATADRFVYLQNEIKPASAAAVYSPNVS